MRVFVAAMALVTAAASSGADHLEGRSWYCSGTEKTSVSGLGSVTESLEGFGVSIDGDLGYVLDHPSAGTYGGTVTERGRSGFTAVPSAESQADFEDYLVETAGEEFGITDVVIARSAWKVSGKVAGDGTIAVKAKVIAKGTGVVSGRTRRGKISWKARITGPENV